MSGEIDSVGRTLGTDNEAHMEINFMHENTHKGGVTIEADDEGVTFSLVDVYGSMIDWRMMTYAELVAWIKEQ